MKYRKDFVTNSSSSSFTCEICGENEFGMDLSLREADMCECVNGHIFCSEHLLERPSKEDIINEILTRENIKYSREQLEAMDIDSLYSDVFTWHDHYDIPEMICPICQFIEYSESDLVTYLLKEYGISKEEVFAEVKKLNKRRKRLYDSEYILYVCQKFNIVPGEIVNSWKEKFGTYKNFKNYEKPLDK